MKKTKEQPNIASSSICIGPQISFINNKITLQAPLSSLFSEDVELDLKMSNQSKICENLNNQQINENSIYLEGLANIENKDAECIEANNERIEVRKNELRSNKSSTKNIKKVNSTKGRNEDANSNFSGYKSTQHSRNSYWPNDSLDILRIRRKASSGDKETRVKSEACSCQCVLF